MYMQWLAEIPMHQPTGPPSWLLADLATMNGEVDNMRSVVAGATTLPLGHGSSAVAHDFVEEWVAKGINITVGWKGGKLPKCGQLTGGHAEATESPMVPVRTVDFEVRPYFDEDGSNCRSGLLNARFSCRHYGALRCASTTHLRGPALY